MKKVLLTISCALLSLGAFAQGAEDFFPGWYFQLKGGALYTAGEASFKELLSPAAAVGAGYQFTPVFGLRGELSGWQSKGAIPTASVYKFNYGQLNVDATFDICNLFNYKYNRLLNPYVFVGIGGNLRFNNQEALDIKSAFEALPTNYLWENPVLSFTGRFGAGLDIRVSDAVAITLEVVDNVLSDKFNSKNGEAWSIGNWDIDFDYNIAALLGLKFSFGAASKRAAAVAAAEAAAAAAAAEAAAKAAAEKAAAEKAAAEKAAAEKAAAEKAAAEKAAAEKAAAEAARAAARATSENIFFTIGKSDIKASEQSKVDDIIALMNKYPEATISISGYADKKTGTAKINMALSEKRAASVAKALTDAGISASRISTAFYGDTVQVSDVVEQNRVAVCVTR